MSEKKAPAEPTEPPQTRLLAFTYIDLGNDNKMKYARFLEVSEEEFTTGVLEGAVESKVRLYDSTSKVMKKGRMIGSPGMVYRVEVADNGKSILPGTAKFKGMWPNNSDRLGWAMQGRASKAMIDTLDRVKNAEKMDPLKEYLDPIREHYRRVGFGQKSQVLAQIVAYITRP